jgi:hypothetical protein
MINKRPSHKSFKRLRCDERGQFMLSMYQLSFGKTDLEFCNGHNEALCYWNFYKLKVICPFISLAFCFLLTVHYIDDSVALFKYQYTIPVTFRNNVAAWPCGKGSKDCRHCGFKLCQGQAAVSWTRNCTFIA